MGCKNVDRLMYFVRINGYVKDSDLYRLILQAYRDWVKARYKKTLTKVLRFVNKRGEAASKKSSEDGRADMIKLETALLGGIRSSRVAMEQAFGRYQHHYSRDQGEIDKI